MTSTAPEAPTTFAWFLTCHRKHCKAVRRVDLQAARDRNTGKAGTIITHPDGTPMLFARDLAGRYPVQDRNAEAGSTARRIYEAALHSGMVCECGTYLTNRNAKRIEGTITTAPCTERCHTATSATCRCQCGGTMHGTKQASKAA